MRRVRLDTDDLIVFLKPVLEEQGYIAEGHQIIGFEYKTRKIKRGGDYYDPIKDGEVPPEGIEIVKWIKVLIGPERRKKHDDENEPDEVEVPTED